jgi:hypothetical protein
LDVLLGVQVDKHDPSGVQVSKSTADRAAAQVGWLAGSSRRVCGIVGLAVAGGPACSIHTVGLAVAGGPACGIQKIRRRGLGAPLQPCGTVLVNAAKPVALVFQVSSLSEDDLLPPCPPPYAHDGPLFRDSLTMSERPRSFPDTGPPRSSGHLILRLAAESAQPARAPGRPFRRNAPQDLDRSRKPAASTEHPVRSTASA